MERKTITRWFWVWQFEKEEEWLNEMAANGWVLESVGFCKYTFVRCEPGEYTVRTEMHPTGSLTCILTLTQKSPIWTGSARCCLPLVVPT